MVVISLFVSTLVVFTVDGVTVQKFDKNCMQYKRNGVTKNVCLHGVGKKINTACVKDYLKDRNLTIKFVDSRMNSAILYWVRFNMNEIINKRCK